MSHVTIPVEFHGAVMMTHPASLMTENEVNTFSEVTRSGMLGCAHVEGECVQAWPLILMAKANDETRC
jgi:hypothetical protein